MSIESELNQKSVRFKQLLQQFFQRQNIISERLAAPMRYSVLNGGKHFRPLLVYYTGESLGLTQHQLDSSAIAVELIHAYSLIHDDLPAMDNAPLRRGQKSCHLQFTEADAILAGDALQMLAIETLTNSTGLGDKIKLKLIQELTIAAGAKGMVAGQSLDIAAEGKSIELSELETIHSLKTGALIKVCIIMPTLIAAPDKLTDLSLLANKLGIAYQVQDDILDIEASTEILGKKQGTDIALEKSTYPKLLGLAESKKYLNTLLADIQAILQKLKLSQSPLAQLVQLIFQRTY